MTCVAKDSEHTSRKRAATDDPHDSAPLAHRIGNLLLLALDRDVLPPEDVGDWLRNEIAKRLAHVPEAEIVYPDPRIAMPVIQALGYSMRDEVIPMLFANLLSASMTEHRRPGTHPAFVDMIKDMVPLDAVMLKEFEQGTPADVEMRADDATGFLSMGAASFCELTKLGAIELASAANNLVRLGLVAPQPVRSTATGDLESSSDAGHGTMRAQIEAIKREHIPTVLGQRFISSCLR